MFKFIKVKAPTAETQQLDGIQMWVVSWQRRYGQFSNDVKQCFQAFTSEKEAQEFKRALEDAHKLIGNTSGTEVTIEKQSSGL